MKSWNIIGNNEIEANGLFKIESFEANCLKVQPFEFDFEFGLFFNSSEERTLEYNKLFKNKSIFKSLLVDFKKEYSELKTNNFKKNNQFLNEFTKEEFIKLSLDDIFKYEENLNEIINKIPESIFKLRSKCFIDITGVPLIYSVALLRYLKLSFPSPNLFFLNVSASYEEEITREIPQFSDGYRDNIYIPGYYGKPDFSKAWLYIFLLGFEGQRSLNIYKVNEPDFIQVILADPGYQKGYPIKAIKKNRAFINETKIEPDKIIRINAGNPIKIFEKILSIYDEYKDIANICLVPLGTKPHAIGAGLAALIKNDISIMYQVPRSYSMNSTKAADLMWIYKIY